MEVLCTFQFKTLSQLGVEAYGVILNESTSECKVVCSSCTTEDFIAAEEGRGEGVDHNFFRYNMCGKSKPFGQVHVKLLIYIMYIGAGYIQKSWKKRNESVLMMKFLGGSE